MRGAATASSTAARPCERGCPGSHQHVPDGPRGPRAPAPATGLGHPVRTPRTKLIERREVPWLEPIPDSMVWANPGGVRTIPRRWWPPASRCGWRSSPPCSTCRPGSERYWSCATFCSGRPPRWPRRWARPPQRATACCSAQRAQLSEATPNPDALVEPESDDARELLRRYVDGFERYDIDAWWTCSRRTRCGRCPRSSVRTSAGADIARLIKEKCPSEGPGDMRCCRRRATASAALGLYMREPDGVHRPFQLHVLESPSAGRPRHVFLRRRPVREVRAATATLTTPAVVGITDRAAAGSIHMTSHTWLSRSRNDRPYMKP